MLLDLGKPLAALCTSFSRFVVSERKKFKKRKSHAKEAKKGFSPSFQLVNALNEIEIYENIFFQIKSSREASNDGRNVSSVLRAFKEHEEVQKLLYRSRKEIQLM